MVDNLEVEDLETVDLEAVEDLEAVDLEAVDDLEAVEDLETVDLEAVEELEAVKAVEDSFSSFGYSCMQLVMFSLLRTNCNSAKFPTVSRLLPIA
jgi:hypothetical protein